MDDDQYRKMYVRPEHKKPKPQDAELLPEPPAAGRDEMRDEAIMAMRKVLADPKANHSAIVAAATALLDRIDGKPVQQVHISKKTDIIVTLLDKINAIEGHVIEDYAIDVPDTPLQPDTDED